MAGTQQHTATPAVSVCRFVSDQAPQGMAALCQHKLLGALEQTRLVPGAARVHPPTQLEWTAGWRRGRMVLDISTFNGEALLSLYPYAAVIHPNRTPRLPTLLLWGFSSSAIHLFPQQSSVTQQRWGLGPRESSWPVALCKHSK